MKIKSILAILDKPKHPQEALASASDLQAKSGAELDLIAFRHNALYDDHHSFDKEQRKKLRKGTVDECYAWLKKISKGRVDLDKTRLRTIWSKDIAGWLFDEVRTHPVDLVVKTLHVSKTLMYTPTDWQILRTCSVPVLLKATKRRRKSSGVVVAALDFSRDDAKRRNMNKKVINAAKSMAELNGGVVHCVYALEISEVLRDLDIIDEKVSKKKILNRIAPQVDAFLKRHEIPKSRMHYPVGKAGRVVNSTAHKLDADLLVVGTGIHRLRQAAGLGSAVERILTKAHRDVLAIHL